MTHLRKSLSHPEKNERKFTEVDNGNEEPLVALEIRKGYLIIGEVRNWQRDYCN